MDKEFLTNLIATRIIEEHRKHPDLAWEEIASRKIISSLEHLGLLREVCTDGNDFPAIPSDCLDPEFNDIVNKNFWDLI